MKGSSATQVQFASPLSGELQLFLEVKRSLGYKYREEERCLLVLDKFLKSVLGKENPVITQEIVRQYLRRRDQVSDTTRSHRLSQLRQFCRFLVLKEPRTFIPPKRFLGIKRASFTPRLFTRAEGKNFLQACLAFPSARTSPMRGPVLGTALMVLYLTGLRAGELLRLTLEDVDLQSGILHLRQTKFGKSREVPITPDLVDHLRSCCQTITSRLGARQPQAPFFCGPRGKPYSITALRAAFHRALVEAKIDCHGKGNGFRLHDLRHHAAVRRMQLWYAEGADLEAKLPLLATYLGHKNLHSTQCYLHLTRELLVYINSRFQARFGHLVDEGGNHEES